ncbi:hypothetical protein BH23GEM9_BH23GEM9_22600 [soil metagenome]
MEFSLIDDAGVTFPKHARLEESARRDYCCGFFVFRKPPVHSGGGGAKMLKKGSAARPRLSQAC